MYKRQKTIRRRSTNRHEKIQKKRDIRLKHKFAGQLPDSEGYNPKIYIKSKYNPKLTDLKLENTLINYENQLIKERAQIIQQSYDRTNLTTQQQNMIKTLKAN